MYKIKFQIAYNRLGGGGENSSRSYKFSVCTYRMGNVNSRTMITNVVADFGLNWNGVFIHMKEKKQVISVVVSLVLTADPWRFLQGSLSD